MLRLSRKIGEAFEILDKEGTVVTTVRVMPGRRAGQISLGIVSGEGHKIKREEVGVSDADLIVLKFKTLMHRISKSELAELSMQEAIDELVKHSDTFRYAVEVRKLSKLHEEACNGSN